MMTKLMRLPLKFREEDCDDNLDDDLDGNHRVPGFVWFILLNTHLQTIPLEFLRRKVLIYSFGDV